MSAIYDNWERLVAAVLKKEQLWQLFHEQSRSPSVSSLSSSSDFSFSRLNSSLDAVPYGFSSPEWSANSTRKPDDDDAASTHSWRRNLTIQVPKLGNEERHLLIDSAPQDSECCSKTRPSPRVNLDDSKQKSYPLPLPPAATSNPSRVSPPNSAKKLPTPPSRSPQGAENVKSPRTSWKKGRLIGKGPLGDVYLGFNSEKGQMCVMKEISLSSKVAESKQSVRALEKDIELLSCVNHPNIVQYYGSETVADKFYIYFEYVSGGSINIILQQYGRLGESLIRSYAQQILSGLAYLHSKGIAHRDIRGANVLVDPNGRVKLCNFAVEKRMADQSGMLLFLDSLYWMAPEAIMNPNVRHLAIDIWSLGCTILEMATTRPPLSQCDREMAMFRIVNHKELPQFPNHLSDVCKDFLKHCLQWNPQHRATLSQLLEHPFVRSSWPFGKQILVSTSSGHPAAKNAIQSEGADRARSPHQLDSEKVVSRAFNGTSSNFQHSDIYAPRNTLAPVSPVGSPILHPRSPQHLSRQMSPPPKSSPHTPMTNWIGAIPHSHVNQYMLQQESSHKISTPSYWDPNILRGVFKFS